MGRDADVGRLVNAWDAARAGRAGAVVIIGEAGIGKSRLVGELSRDLARDGAVTALARCFETSGRPPFAPVADWLRTPALQLAKARLEPAWRAEADRLDPQSRSGTAPDVVRAKVDAWQRRRFFEGLARTVLAVQRPTLLVLEDLQWCDRETLAWIVFVMSLGSDMPLLLVATAREDQLTDDPGVAAFLHTMTSSNRLTRLALAPLTRRATGALGEQLLGRPVTGAEADLLHSVTGGNPLFIVEAARGFPPAGGPGTLDRSELVDVLHRRLAQATPGARELAGLAAAVGRDFSLALLSEASDLGAEEVVRCVDELWRRRILREVGTGLRLHPRPAARCRVRLGATGAALAAAPPARAGTELVHADDLDGFAGQLAEQYDRSDQPDRALRFYARAAEHASRLFAHADAVRMRRRCLELIASRPAGVDRDELELDTLRAMAPPLNALHGYASRELQSALQRAEHLAGALGRRETQLVCLVGLFASSFVQGATAESQRIGARALELAQSAPDLVGQAHFAYGGAAASLGRLTESVHHLELACELSVGDSLSVGTRSEVHSRAWMAHPLWLLGRESDAVAAAEQAVKQARTVEHPYTLAVALAYAAVLHKMRQDRGALAGVLTELTELCEHYEFAYYREWALILTGWLRGGAEGLAEVRLGVRRLTDEGSMARQPYWLCALAEAQLAVGDATAALGTLDAARSASAAFDDRFWLPEVLRLRATLLPAEHAVATLREAAALATAQQSLTLGERCRHDLGLREAEAFRGAPVRGERSPNARSLASISSADPRRRRKGTIMSTATSTASAATADKVPFSDLAGALRGPLITAADTEYDTARAVYNGMIDKHPAAIARCRDSADVIACVRFAREHHLDLAVRGGAHNAGGLGVADDALVIDLGTMRSTNVDPTRRTVRVDGGCTWGDVDHATVAFGLATPSGFLSTTGVGGLTLGGGIGYLTPRFGLTIDNLRVGRGRARRRDPRHRERDLHPDLFWALRGGGGNFGVVTSFVFNAPRDRRSRQRHRRAGALRLRRHRRGHALVPGAAARRCPRSSAAGSGSSRSRRRRRSPRSCGAARPARSCGATAATDDRADELLAPVREFGSPLLVGVQPMPYSVLQSAFDALYPAGLQWYWRADFFDEITRRRHRRAHGVRRAAADRALHDAHVPDRRAGEPGARGRHRVRVPRRRLGRRHGRRRPRSRERRGDLGLGPGVLRRPAPALGGRCATSTS